MDLLRRWRRMRNEEQQGDDLRTDDESSGTVQLAREQAPAPTEQGSVRGEGESWIPNIQGKWVGLRREPNDGPSTPLLGHLSLCETTLGPSIFSPVLPPWTGLQFELWGEDQQG